jgi:polyisoprenoid-binding protein YceI
MILNSPTISGSLTVTGNILTSGSITLSGSVASASYALSASNAQTASFANAFTVAGTLTAQTLVVQTITSSVDFVTGSTRFGSLLANTHTFTGSMNLTGSLTVTTTGTELQVNASGVNLGNALTDSHVISGSLRVNPNGLFVSGSGLVGIGTTSPEGVLTIQGTSAQPSTSGTIANSLLQLVGSLNNQLNIGSNTVAGDYGSYIQSSDNNLAVPYPLNLQPNGGNVGIGTSTPSQKLEVVGGEIKAGRIDSSNEGGQISFGRSTDNATAWYIDAYGNVASPQLRFVNVSNAVVAMTLTGSNVGIGTSSPDASEWNGSARLLHIYQNTTNGSVIKLESSNASGILAAFNDAMGVGTLTNDPLLFYTNVTERMRITSVGNLEMRPITFSGVANNATQTVLSNMGKGTWLVSVANDIDSSDGYSAMLWVRTNEIIQMQVFRVDSMVFSYTNQDLRIQNTSGFTATLYVTAIRMAAS